MTVNGRDFVAGASLNPAFARNPGLKVLHDRVREIPPVDAGHDFHHTLRVAGLAARILAEETRTLEARDAGTEELDAVIAAALLHDCVPVPKSSPLRKESARLCSEKAREWLDEIEWSPMEFVEVIAGAILDHSFSGGRTPRTLIGKALQDADRLEALGALGLYRTIATGVSMGAQLFDPSDPWAEGRALDDRRYTIDHFFTKLLKLPDTFRTEWARGEARLRADFLEYFLRQLRREL
ncbi:HD domain-containing protein [bacterium]|nr:HD domain-containing protein [bacterium]